MLFDSSAPAADLRELRTRLIRPRPIFCVPSMNDSLEVEVLCSASRKCGMHNLPNRRIRTRMYW
jgi:hypothetical protein